MNTLHIAAGGESSRLRPFLDAHRYPEHFPKHLLPLGNGSQTIIDAIIEEALSSGAINRVSIHASPENCDFFTSHFKGTRSVETVAEERLTSFSPFWRHLLQTEEQVVGSFGDFSAPIPWEHILREHTASSLPMTFVAGQSERATGAPVFQITPDGIIEKFTRPEHGTAPPLLTNVGVYVFDPDPEVLGLVNEYMKVAHTDNQDEFIQGLFSAGLARAHVIDADPINVNDPITYERLLSK